MALSAKVQRPGRPLVLVPGMMCDERLFAPQIESLAAQASIWVARITQADTMADLGRILLQDCPFKRFHVAGLSMGGILAMEILRQAPERIAGLALMDTNHRAEPPERQAMRVRQIRRACGGDLRGVLIEEMKPHYLAPGNRVDAELLALILDMGLSLGPEVFERQSLALRDRPDSTETLSAFAGPALVLCGEHDRLCPVSRHEEMAALIPAARLEVVDGAGHIATLERPDQVSQALSVWLQG